MKPATLFVSALASLAVAAPTKVEEKRGADFSALNNFSGFNSLDVNYLFSINSLDLQLLQVLNSVNGFDVFGFQNLFQTNSFDLNSILQFQQLATFLQIAQLGVFNEFSLSGVNLNALNLGLLSNDIGGIDLSSFISASNIPQIQAIASQIVVVKE